MEHTEEISRLISVLLKTARQARQTARSGSSGTASYHLNQYNRILARLGELYPTVTVVFLPLPNDANLEVVATASEQLAAYFHDEIAEEEEIEFEFEPPFDFDQLKDFWRKSAKDLEDLGKQIRDSLESWARQHYEDRGEEKKD